MLRKVLGKVDDDRFGRALAGLQVIGSGIAWCGARSGLRGWCYTVISGTGWPSSSGMPAA